MEESAANEKSNFYVVESSSKGKNAKFIGHLDFPFAHCSLSGLIASHIDPSSWSFVSERLLSEIFLGPLGTSAAEENGSSIDVQSALRKAFEATEMSCNRALELCNDELAALHMQLEQLSNPSMLSPTESQQRRFLMGRSESCKATITRLNDCVTTCICLLRNERDVYIANLGDFFAIMVSAGRTPSGYITRLISSPHDLFNTSEHDRLHSLNMSAGEMNAFLTHVDVHKEKFVRCFAGGSMKKDGKSITADPSIYGPLYFDQMGFIAIYNSAFNDAIEQSVKNASLSVPEIIASKIFPLVNLSPLQKQAGLKTALSSWTNNTITQIEQSQAFYIRWFTNNGSPLAPMADDHLSMAPLTIDVDGPNGFPTWAWAPPAGTVVTADQVAVNPVQIIDQQAIQNDEPQRPMNRVSNQPTQSSSEWIPSYVDLVPVATGRDSQQAVDKVFADYAKGRLTLEELALIGL